MTKQQFIEAIAEAAKKHAASFNISIISPCIAQACLESGYGTSDKAEYNNFHGLKYRENRCPSSNGKFVSGSAEQNADGTYRGIVTEWFSFPSLEAGVRGYFEFIDKYTRLKGVEDPKRYLEIIKEYGYATSINYVANVFNVITSNDLTKYDNVQGKDKTMGYTNSSLVVHTQISPNRNSPRNHAIDTITIHHMAGNLSIERCGQLFANASRQGSSNYGVGTDGRIALYVEEKDRAWTSSSPTNDHRAITIEVANSQSGGNWPVSDLALNATINLVADICKRNGIKQLIWSDNKEDRINHRNGCNMTVHRDFAATACPGPYLMEKMPYIAQAVNNILGTNTPVIPETETPEQAPVVAENEAEKIIWDFLKGKGLNDFAIAGIMGNLYSESGLRSNNLQNSYETKFGLSDEEYTARVDNGSYDNFVRDSAGYGLAQWTYWSRKQNLLGFAKLQGKSIGDLGMQLDFLWQELQGYAGVMHILRNATNVKDASNAILMQYEKPADQSAAVQNRRASFGQVYYDKYAGKTENQKTETGELYRVRKSWADSNSQIGAYRILTNAINSCKEGYSVFDSTGKAVFTYTTQRTYKVKKGDSYWRIAANELGNGSRYPEIMKLNNNIALHPDMVIKLPDK